jgi:hypothetical protein
LTEWGQVLGDSEYTKRVSDLAGRSMPNACKLPNADVEVIDVDDAGDNHNEDSPATDSTPVMFGSPAEIDLYSF